MKSVKVFLCKQIWGQHQSSDMYTCIIYRPFSFMCEIDCINYVFDSINKSKLKICTLFMFGPPVGDRKTRSKCSSCSRCSIQLTYLQYSPRVESHIYCTTVFSFSQLKRILEDDKNHLASVQLSFPFLNLLFYCFTQANDELFSKEVIS